MSKGLKGMASLASGDDVIGDCVIGANAPCILGCASHFLKHDQRLKFIGRGVTYIKSPFQLGGVLERLSRAVTTARGIGEHPGGQGPADRLGHRPCWHLPAEPPSFAPLQDALVALKAVLGTSLPKLSYAKLVFGCGPASEVERRPLVKIRPQ